MKGLLLGPIALIIFTVGILLTFFYWYIALPLWAVGIVYMIAKAKHNKKKRRQAEKAARKAAEEARIRAYKETQDAYLKQLIFLCDNSITIFEQMPEQLKTAEEHLNQAEFEFSEEAFAPFWDSIEKTAKTLGRFDEGVQRIKNNSSQYSDVIKQYEGVPPKFPLTLKSVKKLSVSTSTAERMKEIVRTAQRNFQFATIYDGLVKS